MIFSKLTIRTAVVPMNDEGKSRPIIRPAFYNQTGAVNKQIGAGLVIHQFGPRLHNPMVHQKRITTWAVGSVTCGVLAWLGGVPLLFIDYKRLIGATAGVGGAGPFLIGLLSATLCLLAVILGVVALVRTNTGEFRGRNMAWAGSLLGGLGLAAYLFATGRYAFGWW